MKTELYIFYSWQSDVPGNRHFIDKKIGEAIMEIETLPEMKGTTITYDDSTKNRSGSPSIIDTVHEKINQCDVFIADITPIGTLVSRGKDRDKLIPNPNVMSEEGFALRAIGEHRIILLMKEGTGRIEDLPFDISHRRITPFPEDIKKRKSFSLTPMILSAIEYSCQYKADEHTDKEIKHDIAIYQKLTGILKSEGEFLETIDVVASNQRMNRYQSRMLYGIVNFIQQPENKFIIPELVDTIQDFRISINELLTITAKYFSPSRKSWIYDEYGDTEEDKMEIDKQCYYVWIDKGAGQILSQEQYDEESRVVIPGLGEAYTHIESAYSQFRRAIKINLFI